MVFALLYDAEQDEADPVFLVLVTTTAGTTSRHFSNEEKLH